MPKRRLLDEIEQATNLTQRLKKKKEYQLFHSDDSFSDTEQPGMTLKESTPMEGLPSTSYTNDRTNKSMQWCTNAPISDKHSSAPISTNDADVVEIPTTLKPAELSPKVLLALGIATDDTPTAEYKIPDVLSKQWHKILSKGERIETLEDLMKGHLLPKNCTLLRAPVLNNTVKGFMRYVNVVRGDEWRSKEQNQLGVGLSAIGKVLNMLVRDKSPNDKKLNIIKKLSDGCRILADVHYKQTRSRQIMIADNSLNSKIRSVMYECERDNTLFGKDFGKNE